MQATGIQTGRVIWFADDGAATTVWLVS